MILNKKNIVLRAIEEEDIQCLKEMINNPKIEEMVLGWSFPVSSAQQLQWIRNNNNPNCARYAIEIESKMVGVAIISDIDMKNSTAHLGIKLTEECPKGVGIGSTCIKMLTRYCFNELNLNCLIVNILSYNIASQKTLEKCGFVKEGVLRSRIYKKGAYHDTYSYSLLKSDWCEE